MTQPTHTPTPTAYRAAVSACVTNAVVRHAMNRDSSSANTLRRYVESGRPFAIVTECGAVSGGTTTARRNSVAHLNFMKASKDYREHYGDKRLAALVVVDLRDALAVLDQGNAPGARRCGPNALEGWPAGWLVPDAADPTTFRVVPDDPEAWAGHWLNSKAEAAPAVPSAAPAPVAVAGAGANVSRRRRAGAKQTAAKAAGGAA